MGLQIRTLTPTEPFPWPAPGETRFEPSTCEFPPCVLRSDSLTVGPNLKFHRVGAAFLVLQPDRSVSASQRRANHERADALAAFLGVRFGIRAVTGTYNRIFCDSSDPRILLFDYFSHGLASGNPQAVLDLSAYVETIPLEEDASELVSLITEATRLDGRVLPVPEGIAFRRELYAMQELHGFGKLHRALPASWVRAIQPRSTEPLRPARAYRRHTHTDLAPIVPFSTAAAFP